jgi:hypothetical protein
MITPPSIRSWLRLPRRVALLLGLGALSAAAAKADTGEARSGQEPARVPQQSVKTVGDLLIWGESGRIFVVEPGRQAQELTLGDTPEAQRLRHLLERDGATRESPRALRDRIILVGDGGSGFQWGPPRHTDSRDKTNGAATRTPDKPSAHGATLPVGRAPATEKPELGAGGAKK